MYCFRDELLDYPKKDATTYWECEEYPKAWGHGSKLNPLPKDSIPREPFPMRDATWFSSRTKIPRMPKAMVPVPHKGMFADTNTSKCHFNLRMLDFHFIGTHFSQ